MWPLYLVFIFATATPQQNSQNTIPSIQRKLPQQTMLLDDQSQLAESQRNTCYTMRSYLFRHHDGQAPVPAGMTTCTPANVLQQRRVTTGPNGLFMPLGLKADEQK
jgi:hypothetical protein